MSDDSLLLSAFRFQVELVRSTTRSDGRPGNSSGAEPQTLGDGAFQECTGLEIELHVDRFDEGGRNDRVVQRIGRATFPPLVLMRGMLRPANGQADLSLWRWMQEVISGVRPVRRYDGTIDILDNAGVGPVARWTFQRGLPAKVVGPHLNGRTGEIAIEELHIAHEGLRIEAVARD